MAKKRNIAETVSKKSAPAEPKKSKISNASPRLADETLSTAINALLQDNDFHRRKKAKRAVAAGKVRDELLDSDVFIFLVVTLKEIPFKDRLRPHAMYVKTAPFISETSKPGVEV